MHDGRDARSSSRPAGIDEAEWALRLELAACYRLFDHLGWTEAIFNHITVRVPHAGSATPHGPPFFHGMCCQRCLARTVDSGIGVRGTAIAPC